MNRKSIVTRISKAMKQLVPTAQTILYGSEARGEARDNSDIDLLILVDGDNLTIQDEEKIITPLYDIELSSGILISARVMLKKHWYNRPCDTPFYLNVTKDGIII